MASPPAPPTDVPLAVPPGPPAAGFVLEGCHLVAFDIRPSTLTADAASAGTRTAVTTGGMTKSGAAAARPPGLELTKAAVTALTAVNAGSTLAAHGNGSTGGTTDCASGAAGVDDEEAAATGAAGAAGAAGPADATLGSASGDTAPSGTGDDGGRPAVAAGAAGAGASAAQAAGAELSVTVPPPLAETMPAPPPPPVPPPVPPASPAPPVAVLLVMWAAFHYPGSHRVSSLNARTGTRSRRAVHNQPVTSVPGLGPRDAHPSRGQRHHAPARPPHAAHCDRPTFPAPPHARSPGTQNRWPVTTTSTLSCPP